MENSIEENENVIFINVIQNPSKHISNNSMLLLRQQNIKFESEEDWIKYENKFSVENFSGLKGLELNELVIFLSVINCQGGVASDFASALKLTDRKDILRIYYKYIPYRKISYISNVFNIVSSWLYDNKYISELELNRLLSYLSTSRVKTPLLDDFNHTLIKEDIFNYVKACWKEKDRNKEIY